MYKLKHTYVIQRVRNKLSPWDGMLRVARWSVNGLGEIIAYVNTKAEAEQEIATDKEMYELTGI